jgi:hypothetical protein
LNWYRVTFIEASEVHRPKTLAQVKDSFFKSSLNTDWKQDRFFELLLCLWKEGDSSGSYYSRFSEREALYEVNVSPLGDHDY